MKRSAIARIIIWSLTAIILTGILIVGIAAPSFLNLLSFSTGRSGNYTYGSATLNAAQIDEIEIEWVSGDIPSPKMIMIKFPSTKPPTEI